MKIVLSNLMEGIDYQDNGEPVFKLNIDQSLLVTLFMTLKNLRMLEGLTNDSQIGKYLASYFKFYDSKVGAFKKMTHNNLRSLISQYNNDGKDVTSLRGKIEKLFKLKNPPIKTSDPIPKEMEKKILCYWRAPGVRSDQIPWWHIITPIEHREGRWKILSPP